MYTQCTQILRQQTNISIPTHFNNNELSHNLFKKNNANLLIYELNETKFSKRNFGEHCKSLAHMHVHFHFERTVHLELAFNSKIACAKKLQLNSF